MTSFTPTQTLQTGADIPGGKIRQGEGFGLEEFAFIFHNTVRPMAESTRNQGLSVKTEAGGPRSSGRLFRPVIGIDTMLGTRLEQVGGSVGAFPWGFSMATDEVVFSSRPVPGGTRR